MRKLLLCCLIWCLLQIPGWGYTQDAITNSRNNAIVQAVQKVNPSIINITTTRIEVRRPTFFDEYWNPFVLPRRREVQGLGSGIIIDTSGYILTNQHVIADAQKINVTFPDSREFEATIVGEDYLADLALLKVEVDGLSSAQLGDSNDIMIGEWAIAIGNPFASFVRDPHPTVTVGVISATDRMLRHEDRFYHGLIQTDASINPGNSGGALVNSRGQVIGVNTAIFSTSGGSQGLGFAIPINTARKVLSKLRKYGVILEPAIGLEFQEVSANIAQYLNLGTMQGVIVSQAHEDGLAAKAGVHRLDVIQSVDGKSVNTIDEIVAILRLSDVGDTVKLGILRDGKRRMLQIQIDQLPKIDKFWELKLVDLVATGYASNYRRSGALVVQVLPDSPLSDIRPWDLIYGFSKRRRESYPVRSVEDFVKFARRLKSGDIITIHLERDGKDYYIPNWRVP